ncbi:hypothetical protein PQX77_013271, partial [Marasmius sp. AFHP31]
ISIPDQVIVNQDTTFQWTGNSSDLSSAITKSFGFLLIAPPSEEFDCSTITLADIFGGAKSIVDDKDVVTVNNQTSGDESSGQATLRPSRATSYVVCAYRNPPGFSKREPPDFSGFGHGSRPNFENVSFIAESPRFNATSSDNSNPSGATPPNTPETPVPSTTKSENPSLALIVGLSMGGVILLILLAVGALLLRRQKQSRCRTRSTEDAPARLGSVTPYPTCEEIPVSEKPQTWEKGYEQLLAHERTETPNAEAHRERTIVQHEDSGVRLSLPAPGRPRGSESVIHMPPAYSNLR